MKHNGEHVHVKTMSRGASRRLHHQRCEKYWTTKHGGPVKRKAEEDADE
jgi:hypothetical protein